MRFGRKWPKITGNEGEIIENRVFFTVFGPQLWFFGLWTKVTEVWMEVGGRRWPRGAQAVPKRVIRLTLASPTARRAQALAWAGRG